MTVKQQLIAEIEGIDNPVALVQIFEKIQLVKQNMTKNKGNHLLSQFAGCLNDTDAQNMRNIITNEFNKSDKYINEKRSVRSYTNNSVMRGFKCR